MITVTDYSKLLVYPSASKNIDSITFHSAQDSAHRFDCSSDGSRFDSYGSKFNTLSNIDAKFGLAKTVSARNTA